MGDFQAIIHDVATPSPITVTYSFIEDDQTRTVTTRIDRVAGGYRGSCITDAPSLTCRTTVPANPLVEAIKFDLDYKSPVTRFVYNTVGPDLWGDLIEGCAGGGTSRVVCTPRDDWSWEIVAGTTTYFLDKVVSTRCRPRRRGVRTSARSKHPVQRSRVHDDGIWSPGGPELRQRAGRDCGHPDCNGWDFDDPVVSEPVGFRDLV